MTQLRTALPEIRRPRLRALLAENRLLRALECHNPLSALLASSAYGNHKGTRVEFDMLWTSGFSHATSLGLPDAELSWLERRLDSIADIAAVTEKPLLVDADTGGDSLALGLLCRRLEILGVSGVVIEDKSGAKRTSLASDVDHELEDPETFVQKLEDARQSLQTRDFLLFARTESLIAGRGVEHALARAARYLRSSADGIVVHSKERSGAEMLEFMEAYRRLQTELHIEKPLICIPTAYNHLTGTQLHAAGARIVIHANHMVRAAFHGMQRAAQSILEQDRSLEADELCAPLDQVFSAIGTGAVNGK